MKIYFAPAPTADYTKKKVWSRSFIWMEVLVNLESNKQYPTLVQHGAETHIPIQVMSVNCSPWLIEIYQISIQG